MNPLRQLPNAITLLRIALVWPMAQALWLGEFRDAFTLFFVAAVSDALDGLLAKRFGWVSRFGAIADPLADKLLMVTSYGVLAWTEHLPIVLFFLVIARDLLIVGGALCYHFLFRPVDMAPTWLSKFNTLSQILLVVLVIFHLAWGGVPMSGIRFLEGLVVLTTLASGIDYVWRWGRLARSVARVRREGKER